ncbi:hypothetical protein EV2_042821 [Malus domestica]
MCELKNWGKDPLRICVLRIKLCWPFDSKPAIRNLSSPSSSLGKLKTKNSWVSHNGNSSTSPTPTPRKATTTALTSNKLVKASLLWLIRSPPTVIVGGSERKMGYRVRADC